MCNDYLNVSNSFFLYYNFRINAPEAIYATLHIHIRNYNPNQISPKLKFVTNFNRENVQIQIVNLLIISQNLEIIFFILKLLFAIIFK